MSNLHAVHGRIVDLRRHVNVHLSRRLPFVPSERYELWLRLKSGGERQFTIQTRTMPARRGHEVSLIVTGTQTPQVLGLANWSILDGANYIRTDPPPLLRPRDALIVPGLLMVLTAEWHKTGALLSIPVIVAYLLGALFLRALARDRRAAQVDIEIDREARHTGGPP
jgi:hypothetical protein